MKSYQLLLLSNQILRIFFLFSALIITINTKQAEDIHHSSTIGIDKFRNQNSKNHDTGNYHQLVSTIEKSGVSKKVEDLVTDEGFILTALKQQQQQRRQQQQRQQQRQQQNENEKGVNNEGNSAVAATTTTIIIESANSTITDKQNLSFVGTNFIDFSFIYPKNNPVNKEISLAIHSISNNSNFFQSLINQSIRNDNSSDSTSNSKDSSSNIKWKFLNQRMINLNNGHNNHRRKRWATDDTSDKDEMNKIFDTLSSTNYDSPTIASDEILTSSDYNIHDIDGGDNSDRDRFRIPVESIVIMGSDADTDVDDSNQNNDNNENSNDEIFKGKTFDYVETTDSYEQMNSVEETEKDDGNTEMGIVRIAPEILPKHSIENLMEPTMHYLESEAKEMTKSDETMQIIEEEMGKKMENLNEIMDENLLKSDISRTKNHMGKEDEIDLGTIQEMRISDDPNDAAIACDDETEGSGVQDEELQEYEKTDKTTIAVPEQSSMRTSLDYPHDDQNSPFSSSSSSSSSSPSSHSSYITDYNDQLIVGKHTDSLILPPHQTTITERLISIIPILEQIQSLGTISEIHEFWNNRGHRTDGLTFCRRVMQ
ncbi:unnamed protein product [Wuchereria bancrofti]|uniref:Uncharacterized protein n=1 Tax=Wuchereria bancrofti TaxID=6293 RepID=A0A3P7E2M1_WUCBA|nr:unnamed protein product [Wuchereria bancrofti]